MQGGAPGAAGQLGASRHEEGSARAIAAGIALTLASQGFQAVRLIMEERLLESMVLHPMEARAAAARPCRLSACCMRSLPAACSMLRHVTVACPEGGQLGMVKVKARVTWALCC